MSDALTLARSLVDATNAAKEYAGSEAIQAVTKMLEALEDAYKDELFDVRPEDLVALQTKLKQTQAIRKALNQQTPLPKI